MNSKSFKLSGQGGFSLVELLVVIAVIAIIAAIAIPNIANITGSATEAKNQRNAQSIASVASAATAAGYPGTNAWANEDAVIDDLEGDGVTVTNNNGNEMKFGISPLSTTEKTGAKRYFSVSQGVVSYSVEAEAATN